MVKPPRKCVSFFWAQVCLVFVFVATNLHYHSNLPDHAEPPPMASHLPADVGSVGRQFGANPGAVVNQSSLREALAYKAATVPLVEPIELVDTTELVESTELAESTELVAGALSDGLASQYAEVDWVMGIQARRKQGLEPAPTDPYADLPDAHLQPTYRPKDARLPPPPRLAAGDALRLPTPFRAASDGGLGGAFADDPFLGSYAWPWARAVAGSQVQVQPFEMHFVHVPKCGGTSVTRVLRRMACVMNNGTADTMDCCHSPG
jgi:hypothetical protein